VNPTECYPLDVLVIGRRISASLSAEQREIGQNLGNSWIPEGQWSFHDVQSTENGVKIHKWDPYLICTSKLEIDSQSHKLFKSSLMGWTVRATIRTYLRENRSLGNFLSVTSNLPSLESIHSLTVFSETQIRRMIWGKIGPAKPPISPPITPETCDIKLEIIYQCSLFVQAFLHRGKIIYIRDLSSDGLRPIHNELCQIRDFGGGPAPLKCLKTLLQRVILPVPCLIFSSISFFQRLSYCHLDVHSSPETLSFHATASRQPSPWRWAEIDLQRPSLLWTILRIFCVIFSTISFAHRFTF
jgi:hypothetical protein